MEKFIWFLLNVLETMTQADPCPTLQLSSHPFWNPLRLWEVEAIVLKLLSNVKCKGNDFFCLEGKYSPIHDGFAVAWEATHSCSSEFGNYQSSGVTTHSCKAKGVLVHLKLQRECVNTLPRTKQGFNVTIRSACFFNDISRETRCATPLR